MDREFEVNQTGRRFNDEIDLKELWRTLIRGKWIVIGFTFLFSMGAVFYALSLPNLYKSTVVLAPAESAQGGGLAKLASQFGGLASLAGIDVGSQGDKSSEALEILQSWTFIEEFIVDQGIEAEVFAVSGWNPESNALIYNPSVYDIDTKVWKRDPPKGKMPKPSSWELYEKFFSYLTVIESSGDSFVYIELDYFSPHVAKKWLDALVIKINNKLRARDADEAERNIVFLREQISETSVASMHTVFYGLIEEQMKTLMLAKGASEYVFRTVNESRVPEERSSPNRVLVCFIGAFLGVMLGIIASLLWMRK